MHLLKKSTFYLRNFLMAILIGCFNSCDHVPSKSSAEISPKISVICPTYNREERHSNLYTAFLHQTYENRELIILDDSPKPSSFFTNLQDDRVKYVYLPQRMTLGSKRNLLCEMANGEIIAHFDDDDYYAPTYLTKMLEDLGAADLIKLSVWLAWKESTGSLWQWDTREINSFQYAVSGWLEVESTVQLEGLFLDATQKNQWMDGNIWGYGFSYVYRKSLWKAAPFNANSHLGEDYEFICKARDIGGNLKQVPDSTHLVVHTLHPQSSSKIFPQI